MKSEKEEGGKIRIHCVNLETNEPDFTFNWNERNVDFINFSKPQKYIYEPSAGLMKLGFWGDISNIYNLRKISENTHFFTSDSLITNFDGKIFETIEEL